MKKKILLLLLGQSCLLFGGPASGDVITLKDGERIVGTIQSGGSRQLLVKVGDESRAIGMDQIVSIEFEGSEAPITMTVAPVILSPAPAETKMAAAPAETKPAAVPAPPGITLPAGTEIAARTIDRIDSKKADKYKEYAASLDDPIVLNGVTIAPVNSTAFLRVTEVRNAKVKGHSSLSVQLIAVMINGRRVNVQTGNVDSTSGSQSKRTAIGAGAGAAGGAAVGAAAAGGVGAAVGAGIGAAAGTLGAALTSKGVQIPPETRFTYKLTQDVMVEVPENAK